MTEVGAKLKVVVKWLPDGRTPGIDKVQSFFIKKCEALHDVLGKVLEETLSRPEDAPQWFYTGCYISNTQEREAGTAADCRPITCMPTLYKLFTKTIMRGIRDFVEINGILSSNHLGTVRTAREPRSRRLSTSV